MSDFEEKTTAIESKMYELHLKFKKDNNISSRDMHALAKMFQDRDKNPNLEFDLEMSQVIRGFEWGMNCMRQIANGNNLKPSQTDQDEQFK